MSTLWEDVKKSLGEWFSKAADKAGEITREAADKAEEMTKLGKVKLEIFQLKRDIERDFCDLGGEVFHLVAEEKTTQVEQNQKVISLIAKIKGLEAEMKKKDREYQQIKKSGERKSTEKSGPEPAAPKPPKAKKSTSPKKPKAK
jgi:hypothetical protein